MLPGTFLHPTDDGGPRCRVTFGRGPVAPRTVFEPWPRFCQCAPRGLERSGQKGPRNRMSQPSPYFSIIPLIKADPCFNSTSPLGASCLQTQVFMLSVMSTKLSSAAYPR